MLFICWFMTPQVLKFEPYCKELAVISFQNFINKIHFYTAFVVWGKGLCKALNLNM